MDNSEIAKVLRKLEAMTSDYRLSIVALAESRDQVHEFEDALATANERVRALETTLREAIQGENLGNAEALLAHGEETNVSNYNTPIEWPDYPNPYAAGPSYAHRHATYAMHWHPDRWPNENVHAAGRLIEDYRREHAGVPLLAQSDARQGKLTQHP